MRKCEKCNRILFEAPSLIRECPVCKKAYCNVCWRMKNRKGQVSVVSCPMCGHELQEIHEDEIIRGVRAQFIVNTYIEKNLDLDLTIFNGKIKYNSNTGEMVIYDNLAEVEKDIMYLKYGYTVAMAIEELDRRFSKHVQNINRIKIDSACIPICHFNPR